MREKDIGTLIHEHITSTLYIEESGWTVERCQRVMDRLQRYIPEHERLEAVVIWIEESNAFALPGRHIYISRNLLSLCRDEETVAFILAHEIAHHRLGHVDFIPEFLAKVTGDQVAEILGVVVHMVQKRLCSPRWELEADKLSLYLCAAAGYDLYKCLTCLDILERHALDRRCLSAVFGPQESGEQLAADAPLSSKMRIWLHQIAYGYLPIKDRRLALLRYVRSIERPDCSDDTLAA